MQNLIKVPKNTSITVIGDVHEHPEQFQKMLDRVKPSSNMWFVSCGDYFDKGYGVKTAQAMTDQLIDLSNQGISFAVKGNHEIKLIRKNKGNLIPQLKWWKSRPLSLTFEFYTGKLLTVLHAGVTPKMTWESLQTDIEVCYVRDIDEDGKMIPLKWVDKNGTKTLVKSKEGGVSWHEAYDGRFGYIASGHNAQKDGVAKFYNYSCNLDSAVYETGILTGQVFTSDGNLGELITVEGNAFKPKLNVEY